VVHHLIKNNLKIAEQNINNKHSIMGPVTAVNNQYVAIVIEVLHDSGD